MFLWEPPLEPPTTFQDLLYHLQMTEDEYFQHLKDKEEAEIEYYMDLM
jgi:hypothetical protein